MHEPDWEALSALQFMFYGRITDSLNAALSSIALSEMPEAQDVTAAFWKERASSKVGNVLNLFTAWSYLIRYKLGERIPERAIRPFHVNVLLQWLADQLQISPAPRVERDPLLKANQETLQEALLMLYSAGFSQGTQVRLEVEPTADGVWFRVRFARTRPLPESVDDLLNSFKDHWRAQETAFELATARDFVRLNGSELLLKTSGQTGEFAFLVKVTMSRRAAEAAASSTVPAPSAPPVPSAIPAPAPVQEKELTPLLSFTEPAAPPEAEPGHPIILKLEDLTPLLPGAEKTFAPEPPAPEKTPPPPAVLQPEEDTPLLPASETAPPPPLAVLRPRPGYPVIPSPVQPAAEGQAAPVEPEESTPGPAATLHAAETRLSHATQPIAIPWLPQHPPSAEAGTPARSPSPAAPSAVLREPQTPVPPAPQDAPRPAAESKQGADAPAETPQPEPSPDEKSQ